MNKLHQIIEEVLRESNLQNTFNAIGFANKMYTLWKVTINNDVSTYEYVKNLSFDLDSAKEKAGTDYYIEGLRGKTQSFYVLKFNYNGETTQISLPVNRYSHFIDSDFGFGKYKGEKILDVVNKDPEYIVWMIKNVRSTNNKFTELLNFLRLLPPINDLLEKDPSHIKTQEIKKNSEDISIEKFKNFLKERGFDDNVQIKKGLMKSNTISKEMKLNNLFLTPAKNLDNRKVYIDKLLLSTVKNLLYNTYSNDYIINNGINNYIPHFFKPTDFYSKLIDINNVDLKKYFAERKNNSGTPFFASPNIANINNDLSGKIYNITGNYIAFYGIQDNPLYQLSFIVDSVNLIN